MRPVLAVILTCTLAACAQPQSTGPMSPTVSASPALPDAPPPPMMDERTACNADAAGSLLGQPATDANAERARQLAGAASVRRLAHDAVVTMEYQSGRLNVVFDPRNRIQAIRCG